MTPYLFFVLGWATMPELARRPLARGHVVAWRAVRGEAPVPLAAL